MALLAHTRPTLSEVYMTYVMLISCACPVTRIAQEVLDSRAWELPA